MKGTKTVKFIAVALALILSVGVLVGWTYVDVKGDIGINAVCGEKEVAVTSAEAKITFDRAVNAEADETEPNAPDDNEPNGTPGQINLELKTVAGKDYFGVSAEAKELIDEAIKAGYTATLSYTINADGYVSASENVDLSTLVEENGQSFKSLDVNMAKAEYTLTFENPQGIKEIKLNDDTAQLTNGTLTVKHFDTVTIELKDHYTCETKIITNVTGNETVKIYPNFDWEVKIEYDENPNKDHVKGWYKSASVSINEFDFDNYYAKVSDNGELGEPIRENSPANIKYSGKYSVIVMSEDGTQSWEKEIEIKNVDSTAPTYKFYDSENVFTANIKKSWGIGNYKIYKIEVTVDPTQISEKNLWKAEVWVRGDKKPLSEINLEKGDLTTSFNKNETDSVDKVFIRVFDKAGNTCDFSNSTKITFDPECFEEGFDGYTKELKVWIETDNNKKPKVTLNNGNRPENINVDQVKDENNKPVEGKYTFTATKNGTYVINDWLSYTIDCIDNHAPTVNDIAKPENAIKSINVTANDESTDTSAASGIEAVYLAKVTFDTKDPTQKTDENGNTVTECIGIAKVGDKEIYATETLYTNEADAIDAACQWLNDKATADEFTGIYDCEVKSETGVAKLPVEGNGTYTLVVWAGDKVGNTSNLKVVGGENGEGVIIDNEKPVISLDKYANGDPIVQKQSITVNATDKNGVEKVLIDYTFTPNDGEKEEKKDVSMSTVKNEKDKWTYSFEDGDGTYTINKVTAYDYAGNSKDLDESGLRTFTIDTTDPTATWSLTPNDCTGDQGYFNKIRVLTIEVNELHFKSGEFVYKDVEANTEPPESFSPAKNGSEGNFDPKTNTFTHEFNADGKYQLVSLTLTDEAGNSKTYDFASDEIDGKPNENKIPMFTVDKTSPKITVEYDNNNAQNDKFFNADRTATIKVTEHNFNDKVMIYSEKTSAVPKDSGVYIYVKQTDKDGGKGDIEPSKWAHSGDTHTLTISYKNNVNYKFDVLVIDKAGMRSATYEAPGADKEFDVDKVIKAPEITGVNNGSAYNDNVAGTINYSDANFQTATVRLMRADKNGVYDVTAQHTSALPSGGAGGNVNLVNFDRTPENDGIYTLTATITDKAGNTAESSLTFSVNRFGSTYKFSDYLTSICDKHIQEVTEDLKITEINPNSITDGTVTITRNGKPVDAKDVKAVLQRSGSASGGWYEYLYTISKDYFKEDGMYKIIVSSADEAGNKPNSENNEQFEIIFWVDDTLPEIFGIQGLEDDIINTEKQTVKFTIRDNIGLKTVSVYCDDKEIAKFGEKDFTAGDLVDAEFVINESSGRQHIRIVAEDLSGNVLNTDEKDDNGAFITNISFERDVTVSTNFFVRWFANKPLFFGSLAVIIAAGVGVYFIIAKKKNSKETSAA